MEQPPVPGWAQNHTKLGSRAEAENGMMTSALLLQKWSTDIMQNCDLPPPAKVFTRSEKAVISPIRREYCKDEFQMHRNGGDDEKLELLKALRLSLMRATEAERKAASLAREKDQLSDALLEESLQLLAYKQWVRLLETQVSPLRSRWKNQEMHLCHCCEKHEGNEEKDHSGMCWLVALTLCLGIAGVGLAFGRRYIL